MKVSLCTCLYNSLGYFEKLYDSAKFSFPFDEFVVVDNASTDGSEKIIPKKHPEIKYIRNEKNSFEGAGVKQAISETSGDIIVKCDPDIFFIWKDWHKKPFDMLKNKNIGAVVVSHQYGFKTFKHDNGIEEPEMILGTLFVTRRDVIEKCGPLWDERLVYGVSEWQAALTLRKNGYMPVLIREQAFIHYLNNTSDPEKKYLKMLDASWGEFFRINQGYKLWSKIPENQKFYEGKKCQAR